MKKKQTAVEWLMEQVNSSEYQKAFGQTYLSVELIEQAKEMEKEQMRIIYDGLLKNVGTYIIQSDLLNFEQYYNKNYGNDL